MKQILGNLKLNSEERVEAAWQLALIGTETAVKILENFIDDKTEVNETAAYEMKTLGGIARECLQFIQKRTEQNFDKDKIEPKSGASDPTPIQPEK